MRELVKIRTIKALNPIPNADEIEVASVDGWKMVVRKGEFNAGDQGIMLEVDSLVPSDDSRFAFLEKTKFRVRTVKLRKQISQGVLLPLSKLTSEEIARMEAGESLTDILRVQKYEPPVPISGKQKGTFPTHLVPKTDQERIQNVPEILDGKTLSNFEVTEKLDGTSCTFYTCEFEGLASETATQSSIWRSFGACSRNWEMQLDDDNVYAKLWHELDLERKLTDLGRNIAIQGEIIGPGIQGNKYKRGKQEFYVFDIYDIDKQEYLGFWERWTLVNQLGLLHTPVLTDDVIDYFGDGDVFAAKEEALTLQNVLDFADGKSMLADTIREGVVFKAVDGSLSFKAISNRWLLKNE